jgi:endogenous inhibitor of DNA gyrase (YacG/DUF329 family)
MTSPFVEIEVECPECRTRFKTWYRPSMNLRLDKFSRKSIERATTAQCPACNTKTPLESLIVDEDGEFRISTER